MEVGEVFEGEIEVAMRSMGQDPCLTEVEGVPSTNQIESLK